MILVWNSHRMCQRWWLVSAPPYLGPQLDHLKAPSFMCVATDGGCSLGLSSSPCVLLHGIAFGFLTAWQLGSKAKHPEKDRVRWKLHHLSWPSFGGDVVSLPPNPIHWGGHKVLPKFRWRKKYILLLYGGQQDSGKAHGTRNIAMTIFGGYNLPWDTRQFALPLWASVSSSVTWR